jgi:hypothetical protein
MKMNIWNNALPERYCSRASEFDDFLNTAQSYFQSQCAAISTQKSRECKVCSKPFQEVDQLTRPGTETNTDERPDSVASRLTE